MVTTFAVEKKGLLILCVVIVLDGVSQIGHFEMRILGRAGTLDLIVY